MHSLIDAASVILRRDDQYLLVKRGRGNSAGQYAFPGGTALPGEDAEATARRELHEETGLEAGALREFGRFHIDGAGGPSYALTVFVGVYRGTVTAVAGDDAIEVTWVNAAEASRLDMPISVHDCIAALESNKPSAPARSEASR